MNYSKIYQQLIQRGIDRKSLDGYSERHHIIPRSLGGSDAADNLVTLSAREHFLAHWLLWKTYKSSKLAHAFFMMTLRGKGQDRGITSRQYEIAKRAMSLSKTGKNNHWFGTGGPQQGKSKETDAGVASQSKKCSEYVGDKRTEKQKEWDNKKSEHNKKNGIKQPELPVGSKMMNNGIEEKYVYPGDLNQKLNEGWKFGRKLPAPILMSINDTEKSVQYDEIQQYLDNGWVAQSLRAVNANLRISCTGCRKEIKVSSLERHIFKCDERQQKKLLPKKPRKRYPSKTVYLTCSICNKTGPESRMKRFHFEKCASLCSPETREEKIKRMNKQVHCPHCGTVGKYTIMNRWHFENCRLKEKQNGFRILY